LNFGTKIIHNGYDIDKQTGALSTPIYNTSTFHQEDVEGNIKYDYSRSGNPTREVLENTISILEEGSRGFAFSSGMSAIISVLGIFSAGDHILFSEDVYGGTFRAASKIFSRYGFECEFTDLTDYEALKEKIKSNTKAIYVETPSNPLLKITDIKKVVSIAKENDILVIVDNTFMSPYLQKPLGLGADIVIHSATKFLNGHSDILAGLVVVKNKDLGDRIYFMQNAFGTMLGPQDCWLLLRGIKTLKVRMDYQQESASNLSKWLQNHPKITSVYYPGLENHAGSDIHFSQSTGAGAVLSFKTDTKETVLNFMKNVKCAAVAVSLGGVETIVSYPVKMSHASMPIEQREKLSITDNLIRVSLGLEDVEDLIEDFERALS
jgi:cysteine-S-conjugate beta-lyase